MATKAKWNLKGLKTAHARGRQRVFQTVGKREETKDVGFVQEEEKFKTDYKNLKSLQSHLTTFCKSLKAISEAHEKLNSSLTKFYDTGSRFHAVDDANQRAIMNIEDARQSLHDFIDDSVLAPLDIYIGQYKIVERRIEELDRRKTDMDRYKANLRELRHTPETDEKSHAKLEKAEKDYLRYKAGYRMLSDELKRDFNALKVDMPVFIDPCLMAILQGEVGYYTAIHNVFQTVLSMGGQLDIATVHCHPHVITPEKDSAASIDVTAESWVPPDQYQYMSTINSAPVSQYPGTTQSLVGGLPPQTLGAPQSAYGGPPQSAYGVPQSQPMGGFGAQPQSAYGGPPQSMGYPQNGGRGSGIRGPPPSQMGRGYGAPPQSQGGFRGPPPSQGNPRGGRRGPPRSMARGGVLPARPNQKSARALYNFTADNSQELSFQVGDILNILSQNGDWWDAEKAGQRGLVPANYLQVL
eukprot:CAMPEP_0174276746 /NCGR_PEP_ID=MMETSP0439-20130205/60557_1 /TAXON_ID=0 /ORGANISM="Stereomyxa ramosa, Strain Chinc5" /LENGTH=466 /DNA_ID=CAMNT_0015369009 /DNA_START=30 /DNA_END=1430 /DNA_ORIENTATION=+